MSEIQHNEKRNYTSAKGTSYSLPHDEKERQRLNKQNSLFRGLFDGRIMHVPVELSGQDWVLETGSGTGIWLTNLAKEIPAQPTLIGADIEPLLFPEPSSLPPNLSFQIQSVLDLPSEWTNKFTIVNQRLLVASLRSHEWPRAIAELYRVTKPGGWIELLQLDGWTSSPVLDRFTKLIQGLSKDQGGSLGRVMPRWLEESGFADVHRITRATVCGKWAGQHGIAGRENVMGVARGLKAPVLKRGGYGVVSSEADFDSLMAQMEEEYDNTPGTKLSGPSLWP